ncbi:Isoquinoline 1-oxidoreductase subunit [Sphingobium sp. BYY-5]|uniref:Isoquinoline 1-oxidoreductase subunit n=1 Tax=Sphingobium sp. BYY-5 TaxID=2926400 RepID=UPI001FA79064|nr:Isoquinoline 1-oxidoreductase subunit [Sphingobium sp. BYY-5]MCI4592176.1 Isoquinoline 1-oxidoreductase subunit [Sphingobium sp. BYY-5]
MRWRRPRHEPRRRRFGCLLILALTLAAIVLLAATALRPRALPQGEPLPSVRTSAQRVDLRPVSDFAAIADPAERSVALFEEAGRVIQHPRCLNCHPRSDRPTQTDEMRPHSPAVLRGEDGHGLPTLRCTTCHHAQNAQASGVPGNPKWALAPLEMAWQGKSLGDICRQLLDPARSHMTREQLLHHMAQDGLVGWAWHPGDKRTPAPGTQNQFGNLIKSWIETGAQCPA